MAKLNGIIHFVASVQKEQVIMEIHPTVVEIFGVHPQDPQISGFVNGEHVFNQ